MRWFVESRAALGTGVRGMIANRMRAFLSTLGVAIGVATLMSIYSLVAGMKQSFVDQISQLGANTFFVTKFPFQMRGNWWQFRNRPPLTKSDADAVLKSGGVLTAVAPIGFNQAEVGYLGQNLENVEIRGTNDEYINASSLKIDTGRFLTAIDVELDESVVIIGSDVKKALFKDSDPLGQHINVRGERFRVIGTLVEQGKMFGRSQDNLVIVTLGRFESLFGNKRSLLIAVAAPPQNQNQAIDQVTEVLRRKRGLSADKDDNFTINQQDQLMQMFNDQTAIIVKVGYAIGLIALLVGGIGVMNIMLVAVTERTREIGVRRALGARKVTILVQFLTEAMLVTLFGGMIGTGIGIWAAHLIGEITPLTASVSTFAAVISLLFSAMIGVVFGSWPAYRAASLDPIESLRYE